MTVFYRDDLVTLHHGDALDVARRLEPAAADCIVTSPPYFGLRDYGVPGQYGLEASPAEYVEAMRALFGELRRVLADDGTLWLNIGDSYASGGRTSYDTNGGTLKVQGLSRARAQSEIPGKNLLGIPWRVAFALQDDGWILRNAIIWNKPNAMPESVRDRLSGRYEHVFMFAKQPRYWFDLDPIREQYTGDRAVSRRVRTGHVNKENSCATPWTPCDRTPRRADEPANAGTGLAPHTGYRGTHDAGRNPGDVWNIPTQPFPGAHFAVFPPALPRRCIQAGCKPGGTVLDPFHGSGTTGRVALDTGRRYIGIELNADYLQLSLDHRFAQPMLNLCATPSTTKRGDDNEKETA